MAFEAVLQEMLSRKGVEAIVLLDSEGEAILCYGTHNEERLKLLGAYQGIILSTIAKFGMEGEPTVVTLCRDRSILTHHLKDGYFITVVFKDIQFANIEAQFYPFYSLLKKEL